MPRKMKWGDRSSKHLSRTKAVGGAYGQSPMILTSNSQKCLWFVNPKPKRVTLESWNEMTCGKPTVEGYSYCEEHKKICYTGLPPKPKKKEPAHDS